MLYPETQEEFENQLNLIFAGAVGADRIDTDQPLSGILTFAELQRWLEAVGMTFFRLPDGVETRVYENTFALSILEHAETVEMLAEYLWEPLQKARREVLEKAAAAAEEAKEARGADIESDGK